MAHILLVDDDGHIREIVHFALKQAGHRVTEAKDGALGWQAFQRDTFELAILDIVMPELDGLELCRNIRKVSTLPILFLSSRDEELDRVLGLELGADDYITKPFSPRELVARVKAALRRYQEILELKQGKADDTRQSEVVQHGEIAIDVLRHRCTVRGVELTLTVTEFDLLRTLLARPGRVFSRSELVEQAYGEDHHVSERTVDSHLRRVRQKVRAQGLDPIETVYGVRLPAEGRLMKEWRIRWLLLGVSAAVFVLPALSLLALRTYTGYLVRRTEEQLLGQGVLIAEAYRDAWRRDQNLVAAPPGQGPERTSRYAPAQELLAEHIHEQSPSEPADLPLMPAELQRSPAYRAGHELESMLRRAQVVNLSAVRILEPGGCVVATTRGDGGRCLGALPEVNQARRGQYAAVLRARVSDEPPPPLESLSRRGDQRLFIALPIIDEGAVIGVVRLSRTAESGLEWIWKNRLPLLGGVALVVMAALILSLVCAGLIARPLERMAAAAGRVSVGGAPWPEGVARGAPRELAVLGEALGVMTARLAARAKYVADFAANVSHELKTPLTSIRGAAELLREQWKGMDEPQRDRFLANVQADAERTEALVRGLLHLARIENQAEEPPAAPVPLGDVKRALLERYPQNVDVTVDAANAVVSIAPEHLHSVLGNLIDNALRYRRSEPVHVALHVHDTRLHIEVRDDGPGITPANLPRVFERFFTTERDDGGTGLGLAIVRAIAEARGGSALCESSSGGTRFSVVI